GTDLTRNANRRRGRFAPGRLHRRSRGSFSRGSGDQREPEGPDRTGPAHADPARRESHQDALRPRRRFGAHAGRGRAELRGNPRTYPPDRSQSATEVASSLALAKAARVHGWSAGLTSSCRGGRLVRPASEASVWPRIHTDQDGFSRGTASAVPFFSRVVI